MASSRPAKSHLNEALRLFREVSEHHVASPAREIFVAKGLAELTEALIAMESRLAAVESKLGG